jgi:amino acid transporter
MSHAESKLGFNGTWSMAVGGMIGGGIFSTLGVVVGIAGPWAWLGFAVGGLIALAAGYSYVKLAAYYGEGGGAFTFLREIDAVLLARADRWDDLPGGRHRGNRAVLAGNW